MTDKKHKVLPERMNKVGGQAVLEGVMMKGGENVALAVRSEDGTIKLDTKKHVSVRKKYKICRVPVIRGAVNMVETFMLSYSTLEKSAEMLGIDTSEPETKFEKWLAEKLGDSIMKVLMGVSVVFGVAVALLLFKFLPSLAAWALGLVVDIGTVVRSVVEGVVKMGLFILYIALMGLIPDMMRTFEYHGSEHKSIACYESGMELTPENAAKCTRFHPRCGTSFIFVVLIISIIVFSFIPWDDVWARIGLQLLLLPWIVGFGFEFIMYAGRHQNLLTKILSAPGLWVQRLTTKEPSLDQLEVAIASLKAALPDEFPPEENEPNESSSDRAENAESGDTDCAEAAAAEGEVSSDAAATADAETAHGAEIAEGAEITDGADGKNAPDGGACVSDCAETESASASDSATDTASAANDDTADGNDA